LGAHVGFSSQSDRSRTQSHCSHGVCDSAFTYQSTQHDQIKALNYQNKSFS